MNQYEERGLMHTARINGLLHSIRVPECFRVFRMHDAERDWDEVEEDREVGRGISVDDVPEEWDEIERAYPVPEIKRYPPMYGGFIPSGH
jgi:hypothetical protein